MSFREYQKTGPEISHKDHSKWQEERGDGKVHMSGMHSYIHLTNIVVHTLIAYGYEQYTDMFDQISFASHQGLQCDYKLNIHTQLFICWKLKKTL